MSWRDKDERRRVRDEIEAERDENSEGLAAVRFARVLWLAIGVGVALFLFDVQLTTKMRIGLGVLGFLLILAFLKWRAARTP